RDLRSRRAKPITLLYVSVATHTPAHSAVYPIGSCAFSSPCSKAIVFLIPPALGGRHILTPFQKHHVPLDKSCGILFGLSRAIPHRFRSASRSFTEEHPGVLTAGL